jgi:hypothetical protein
MRATLSPYKETGCYEMFHVASDFDGTPEGSRLFGRLRGTMRCDIKIHLNK